MVMLGSCNLDEIHELGQIWIFSHNYPVCIVSLDANSFLKYFKWFQNNNPHFQDYVYNQVENFVLVN